MSALETQFLQVSKKMNDRKKEASSLETADLLSLYAHYKQATAGRNRNAQPPFYYFEKRAKHDAWAELGKMSKEEAMREYIALSFSLVPDLDGK